MEKEEIQVRVEKYFDDLHATMWGQAYNLYDSVSRPLGVKYLTDEIYNVLNTKVDG